MGILHRWQVTAPRITIEKSQSKTHDARHHTAGWEKWQGCGRFARARRDHCGREFAGFHSTSRLTASVSQRWLLPPSWIGSGGIGPVVSFQTDIIWHLRTIIRFLWRPRYEQRSPLAVALVALAVGARRSYVHGGCLMHLPDRLAGTTSIQSKSIHQKRDHLADVLRGAGNRRASVDKRRHRALTSESPILQGGLRSS